MCSSYLANRYPSSGENQCDRQACSSKRTCVDTNSREIDESCGLGDLICCITHSSLAISVILFHLCGYKPGTWVDLGLSCRLAAAAAEDEYLAECHKSDVKVTAVL
jgi:hypothetical protein